MLVARSITESAQNRRKLGATEVTAWRYDVDTDGPIDPRGMGQLSDEASPEITGDAGDEYDLAHVVRPR